MDETNESRTGTADGSDPREHAPEHGTSDEERQYGADHVESTVRDVEGVEYEGGGNVAGASPGADLGPVEPETPTVEGAVFVLLGVALTLVVLAQLVGF